MRAMQVKRVPMSPAVSLIGRVSREAMLGVLSALDDHSAGFWRVSRTGVGQDGGWFAVEYWPVNRPGCWEMVFGLDGSLWSD
jgi:hypothetical protein